MEKYGEWISVSDRLPKPEGDEEYLVTVAHFDPAYHGKLVTVCDYDARDERIAPHWSGDLDKDGTRVVAWMPLPAPYMSDQEKEGISIWECGLSTRISNALCRNGIKTLQEVDGMTRKDLMEIRNIGKKCVDELLDTVDRFLRNEKIRS